MLKRKMLLMLISLIMLFVFSGCNFVYTLFPALQHETETEESGTTDVTEPKKEENTLYVRRYFPETLEASESEKTEREETTTNEEPATILETTTEEPETEIVTTSEPTTEEIPTLIPYAEEDDIVTRIAKECINGNWGNNQDRRNRIKAAGYDYVAVQTRVNELLGIYGIVVDPD